MTLKPPRRKRWLLWSSLLLVGLLVAFHAFALQWAAELLVFESTLAAPSHVGLLGREHYFGEAVAYQRQRIPILILELAPGRLERLGVLPLFHETATKQIESLGGQRELIEVREGPGGGDWDRARCFRAWLEENPEARVLVLCDRFSSRRQYDVYRAILTPEQLDRVAIRAIPHAWYHEGNWWRNKYGFLAFFDASVRLLFVRLQGEDSAPWVEWDPDAYRKSLS